MSDGEIFMKGASTITVHLVWIYCLTTCAFLFTQSQAVFAQDKLDNIEDRDFIESLDSIPFSTTYMKGIAGYPPYPIDHEYKTKPSANVWYTADWAFAYVQKTTDGGKTWDTVLSQAMYPPLESYRPYSIDAPTENLIFLGCNSGALFRSQDGGNTWEKYQFPNLTEEEKDFRIEAIAFKDSLNGIVAQISYDERIFRTYNGGDTWVALEYDIPYGSQEFSADDIYYDDEQITIIFSTIDGKLLYRSFDEGATWKTIVPERMPVRSRGVLVHSIDTLYCTPKPRHEDHWSSSLRWDQLCASYDGGNTWQYLLDNFTYRKSFGVHTYHVYEDGRHMLLTGSQRIFFTNNGGKTWFRQEDSRGRSLSNIITWNIEEQLSYNTFRLVYNDFRNNFKLTIDPSFFVTSVEEQQRADDFAMQVVPNMLRRGEVPRIIVPSFSSAHPITLSVYNLHGTQVYSTLLPTANTEHHLTDFPQGLASGTYYVVAEAGNVVFHEEIVVE
jgi:photosystem II stability/assembly factor-like uncharacterized protein